MKSSPRIFAVWDLGFFRLITARLLLMHSTLKMRKLFLFKADVTEARSYCNFFWNSLNRVEPIFRRFFTEYTKLWLQQIHPFNVFRSFDESTKGFP